MSHDLVAHFASFVDLFEPLPSRSGEVIEDPQGAVLPYRRGRLARAGSRASRRGRWDRDHISRGHVDS